MARRKDTWGDEVAGAPWARLVGPAPGDLRIVQAFANTKDLAIGGDELSNPRTLRDWLVRWRLLPPGTVLTQDDVARTAEVRDGLHAMLAANNGRATNRAAVARLDQATETARLRVRFESRGATRFEPAHDALDGALARLVQVVALAQVEDVWRRLKLCANPDCCRAFYDGSPNLSGKWCSMQRCGGRSKARAYRRRHPDRLE